MSAASLSQELKEDFVLDKHKTIDTNKELTESTDKIDEKINENFTKLFDEIQKETKEKEYLDIIKLDNECVLNIKIENDCIYNMYGIDMELCSDEDKKNHRKNVREIAKKLEKDKLEEDLLINGITAAYGFYMDDEKLKSLMFKKILSRLSISNFKQFLEIMLSNYENSLEIFKRQEKEDIKINIILEECKNLRKINTRMLNFLKEINGNDDEKYLVALKQLTNNNWFLDSIASMSLSPGAQNNLMHNAIDRAFGKKDNEEPNIKNVNFNRIKMLIEYVPFDVWFCPWFENIEECAPIQLLSNCIGLFVDFQQKGELIRINSKKEIKDILVQFNTSMGDKHNLRFVISKYGSHNTTDLLFWFKDIPINDEYIDLSKFV